MKVLMLKAGSSSLKCAVMAAADCTVIADSLTDWAGAATHYRYAGPDGKERSEDVSWKGYAPAVQRVLYDLTHVEPVALSEGSALAAVGHRVVHCGQFTSSVRITPEIPSRIAPLAYPAPLPNPPSLDALAAALDRTASNGKSLRQSRAPIGSPPPASSCCMTCFPHNETCRRHRLIVRVSARATVGPLAELVNTTFSIVGCRGLAASALGLPRALNHLRSLSRKA